ncbi:MAG: metal-independent alpha-mannosidase [Ardenticatenia bacterium]|nr:MAG: metal-independent alpha-mannosidase [Ardenticatenia bacterium]
MNVDAMRWTDVRWLDQSRPYKPLDTGNGRVALSVAYDGRLLAINTAHDVHGTVSLGAVAAFPDAWRYDQTRVRAYRAWLASPGAPTFGLEWGTAQNLRVGLLADVIPVVEMETPHGRVRGYTFAPPGEQALCLQVWVLEAYAADVEQWSYRWTGTLGLARAAMTQLTEGGILPAVDATLFASWEAPVLHLVSPALQVESAIAFGHSPTLAMQSESTRVHVRAEGLCPMTNGQGILAVAFTLGQGEVTTTATQAVAEAIALLEETVTHWRRFWLSVQVPEEESDAPPCLHRAVTYPLTCCAVPLDDTCCLLTDHMILPLSWTRDAYYIMRALWQSKAPQREEILYAHVRWLFERAERPHGYWGRSYLSNGRIKDPVFQLDQQCYPLLELVDLLEQTGETALAARYAPVVAEVLAAIERRRAPGVPFVATDETPADDPMPLPYHFSSLVLLWYTFSRLAGLAQQFPLPSPPLWWEDLASAIRDTFTAEWHGHRLFAYAADAVGRVHIYHDANDFPTLLAPVWGFCSPNDPVWQATMAFAFSPANEGFADGPFGGLGSRHTPGAWPLGDAQELLLARLTGDEERIRRVLARLQATAFADGGLPEARDPATGQPISRHWFAWPNAALLFALTLDLT